MALIEALVGPNPNEVGSDAPRWSKWHEIFRVIAYPPYLRKTLRIALIFGSVLFAINHLDEVVSGRASLAVWIKGGLTFLVPFCVSNLGVLVASRRGNSDAASSVAELESSGSMTVGIPLDGQVAEEISS